MLHQIGIGTLGPVFRTYEPSRDRLVAVKAFRLDIVPEQAQALALALSRAAHASLFHPSIVEPIDSGVEGTLAYRAEEYVAAESLDVAMRHYAPAPIEKVLPFITQLAGAIDFARAAGIGHGGLHPRDIFVTPDEARATGFGVVEALEQVGIRAPVRRPYSPPERIAGSAWGTPADVFSLAAITFELLTGKRPSGTGAQIGALADAPNATAIHAVLARAMDDDPARRYTSALAFAAALEGASQGRSTSDTVLLPPPVEQVTSRRAESEPAATRSEPARSDPDATLPQAWHGADAENEAPEVEPTIVGSAAVPLATAGEFEIEKRLDPVHAALASAAEATAKDEPAVVNTPTLFGSMNAATSSEEQFANEFVEEQKAEPEFRSPLDEPRIATPAAIPEEPLMFRATDPELHDERSRSAILPYALTLVLGLLAGFAGGYFMGSRGASTDEAAKAPATAAPAPSAATATSGPATSERPGQYSEQKVTPPASASGSAASPAAAPSAAVSTPPPAARRTAPPPVARETATVQRGQIVVHSTPSRAGVTVNGKWRGRTPLTLENLPFGAYTVRVVQPGYLPGREEFSLNTRTPSHTFTARLERSAATATKPAAPSPSTPTTFTGSIFVDSRPRGASVIVDGRNVGQTPVSVPDVRAGSHVVRIEMTGKKPVMANPRVVAGQTERITVSLEDRESVSAAAREVTSEAAPRGAAGAQGGTRSQRRQAGEGKR